ncbi:hypothetical protein KKG52_02835 [Patescibacteria group bacterium]|nr:hypothetical protein [Patescibacteria group bacterium]
MLSLSNIALETRLIIKWGGISLGAIIFLVVLFQIGIFTKNAFFPKEPDPPTVSFGKLPKINFPKNTSDENFTYQLDTTTGKLPDFPDRLDVFEIEKPEPDLLAVEKAQEKMSSIRIYSKGFQVDSRTFNWKDEGSSMGKTINYDIFSHNFQLKSNYQSDPEVLSANGLFEEQVAINTARDMIYSLAIKDEKEEGVIFPKTKTNLYSIRNGTLFPATSISNTQVIEVFFFHNNVGETPIFYSNPKKTTMHFLVSGGQGGSQVVEASFFYQKASSTSATYPIKTADELFNELKKGNGYISSYDGQGQDIKIKNIFLAYYMSEEEQNYLIPIVVFEGNNDFYAYLSAVKDEWLSN